MDPENEPAAFQETISGGRSRAQATVVIAAAALVVGAGIMSSLLEQQGAQAPSALPTTSAPAAAATSRPTPRPTPTPSPMPTLAPLAAPVAHADQSPTGVLVADAAGPGFGELVPGSDGTIWASRAGAVVNIDPRTGRGRAWTLADDPAFATSFLSPARHGGVWLVGQRTIRRFDGVGFPEVIQIPAPLWSMAEADDGSIWAQTQEYGLVRWADGTWTSDPPGRVHRWATDIEVAADGRVWTVDDDVDTGSGAQARAISAWDGSAWISYPRAALPIPTFGSVTLLAADDGAIWVYEGRALARYRAQGWTSYEYRTGGWTSVDVPGLDATASLSAVGDDGRLWFVAEPCDVCGVRIQAYDGAEVATYDSQDGLPGPDDGSSGWADIEAGQGVIVASTEAGLYRLTHGRWSRLTVDGVAETPLFESSRPAGAASIAARSRDEVWAVESFADGDPGAHGLAGLYRFDGTAWHRASLPVEATLGQVAAGRDGSLWVATSTGPLVLRDRAWTDLGGIIAKVVPDPGKADPDCGGAIFLADDGIGYYVGPRSGNQVVAVAPAGRSWRARVVAPALTVETCPEYGTLAASGDGTLWRLDRGWGSTLSRSNGGPWEVVRPSPDPTSSPLDGVIGGQVDPAAIVVDRDGSLWVALATYSDENGPDIDVVRLADGSWTRQGIRQTGTYISRLALLPDGSLIAVGDGIAVFDGQRFRRWVSGAWFDTVSVAPDGAVWLAGPNVYRLPPSVPWPPAKPGARAS